MTGPGVDDGCPRCQPAAPPRSPYGDDGWSPPATRLGHWLAHGPASGAPRGHAIRKALYPARLWNRYMADLGERDDARRRRQRDTTRRYTPRPAPPPPAPLPAPAVPTVHLLDGPPPRSYVECSDGLYYNPAAYPQLLLRGDSELIDTGRLTRRDARRLDGRLVRSGRSVDVERDRLRWLPDSELIRLGTEAAKDEMHRRYPMGERRRGLRSELR